MKIQNVWPVLALVLSVPFAAFAMTAQDEGEQEKAAQIATGDAGAALDLNDGSADEWRGGRGRGWGGGGWGRGWGYGGWGGGGCGWGGGWGGGCGGWGGGWGGCGFYPWYYGGWGFGWPYFYAYPYLGLGLGLGGWGW